jgi:glycosyltransferase involved in cell wall biosynthesis
MQSKVEVSVCMATYNGELYLRQQIDSILNQLSDKDELIISDDSSTDDTIKIIKGYQDSRIRLLEGNLFRNPIYNFENALKNAQGDIVFLSDQDDVWHPDKVKLMKPLLEKYGLVLSDCKLIDEKGVIVHESLFKQLQSKQGFWRNLIGVNPYIGCCMGISKEILNLSLPFPKGIPMHDIWLGNIAAMYSSTFFLSEKLVLYRRHNHNASQTGTKSKNSLYKKIKIRLNTIQLLTKHFIKVAFKKGIFKILY